MLLADLKLEAQTQAIAGGGRQGRSI